MRKRKKKRRERKRAQGAIVEDGKQVVERAVPPLHESQ